MPKQKHVPTPSPKVKAPRATGKVVRKAPTLRGIHVIPSCADGGLNLTPAEIRLIKAYRNVCDETQEFLVRLAERNAQNPALSRQVQKPALRLVAGGAHV